MAPLPAHLRVYVPDAEDAFTRDLRAGARAVAKPTALAFGERVARVRDAQGHLWWIHQHFDDVAAEDVAARLADLAAQAAMAYVEDSLVKRFSSTNDRR